MTDTLAQRMVIAMASGILDESWYSRTNPDVAQSGASPATHYLTQGWREGRDPGPLFRTTWYVERYAGQLAGEMDPLCHYLTSGWRQGNRPSPEFDPDDYLARYPQVRDAGICPLVHEAARRAGYAASLPHATVSRTPTADEGHSRVTPLTVIAHYLPQFHPIAENDQWWGEGFTEWRNVQRGSPRFPGHEQPHVPGDLGYYDLGDPAILRRQVDLAREYGVTAFCFYTYWFAGRRLLEKPLEDFAADPSLDLAYCICWANESWTRAWDGDDSSILMEQTYPEGDDIRFIEAHAHYLADPRYLRVEGRPVIAVYRAQDLPDGRKTAERWRAWARDNGIGEIHLVAMHGTAEVDPRDVGFDAAAEFWPNGARVADLTESIAGSSYAGRVYDWTELARRSEDYLEPGYDLYRGACVSWDSEARRPGWGTTMWGATPDGFRDWLMNAGRHTLRRFADPSRRLVWVNAWNEWAEGCHLEPDQRWGYRWLEAVRAAQRALTPAATTAARPADPAASSVPTAAGSSVGTKARTRIAIVTHDMHRHGAQFGSLALARTCRDLGYQVECIALGGGDLEERFRFAVPSLTVIPAGAGRQRAANDAIDTMIANGVTTVLVNSLAAAWFAVLCHQRGQHVELLIHEMPGVIAEHEGVGLDPRSIAGCVDGVVVASEEVLRRFPATLDATPVRVIPQGLYSRDLLGMPLDDRGPAKAAIGLGTTTPLVIGIGFGDHRKGFDRFVDVAALDSGAGVHYAWVGQLDDHDARMVAAQMKGQVLPHLTLTGFLDDVSPWLAAADVLLLPSREDPYPSVVLEAAAAGCPTVAIAGATGMEEWIVSSGGVAAADDSPRALIDAAHALLPVALGQRALLRDRVLAEASHHRYVIDLLATTPAAQPRVSVGVPSYNHEEFIPERLASILGQTLSPTEVVVVDDASPDASAEVSRATLSASGMSCRIVVNEVRLGSAFRQWDRVARLVTDDLVWIAESDDSADPRFIDEVVSGFTDDDVVLAFCQSRPMSADGRELAPDYVDYLATYAPEIDWRAPFLMSGSDFANGVLAVLNPILTVSSTIIRRQALLAAIEDVEPLLTTHPTTGDWLIYDRLLARGCVSYTSEVLSRHRRHEGSIIGSADRSRHIDEMREAQGLIHAWRMPGSAVRARASAYLTAMEAG